MQRHSLGADYTELPTYCFIDEFLVHKANSTIIDLLVSIDKLKIIQILRWCLSLNIKVVISDATSSGE